jgi:carbamate kinase
MQPTLLSRKESAAYLGVSLRYFQAHICPVLTRIEERAKLRAGLVRYEREELDRWVAEHRVGPSGGIKARGKSAGRRQASASSGPLDAATAEIEALLRRQLPKSTRRSSAKVPTDSNVVELATRRSSNG